jgi:phosphate-selective porin O and P family protein
MKLYGRWDCYRDDASTWQGLKTNWGFSSNYRLGKNYLFQLNYTHTHDRAGADRDYNTFDVQFSARF